MRISLRLTLLVVCIWSKVFPSCLLWNLFRKVEKVYVLHTTLFIVRNGTKICKESLTQREKSAQKYFTPAQKSVTFLSFFLLYFLIIRDENVILLRMPVGYFFLENLSLHTPSHWASSNTKYCLIIWRHDFKLFINSS